MASSNKKIFYKEERAGERLMERRMNEKGKNPGKILMDLALKEKKGEQKLRKRSCI